MKLTIMRWKRQTGKTHSIVEKLKDGIPTLVLVPNPVTREYIKSKLELLEIKTDVFVYTWGQEFRGLSRRVFVDNAGELPREIFEKKVVPVANALGNSEIVLTYSFEEPVPEYILEYLR